MSKISYRYKEIFDYKNDEDYKEVTCSNCNGLGEENLNKTKCSACKGSGIEYVLKEKNE